MGTARPDPVDYMLQVAATPEAVAYKSYVLAEMALTAGVSVVDVGCGPATDLQGAADLVAPGGVVVGLDFDRRMLTAAARRASSGVALLAGDAHSLPLRSKCIDRIRTDRALQHMRDPRSVLQEFRRVLTPGGIAVLAEPDWRTLAVDGGPQDIANRFVDYTCEQVVLNATVGRGVARLGQAAGFLVSNVVAFPTVFRDFAQADRIFGLARNAHAAAEAGYLTKDQAAEWLADLFRGPVSAAVTLFVTTLVLRRGGPNVLSGPPAAGPPGFGIPTSGPLTVEGRIERASGVGSRLARARQGGNVRPSGAGGRPRDSGRNVPGECCVPAGAAQGGFVPVAPASSGDLRGKAGTWWQREVTGR